MNQNYESTIEIIKSFDLALLLQTNNIVNGLIKSKHINFNKETHHWPKCPHCGSSIIKKNGKTHTNNQRYLCLNQKCNKSFSSNTKSFLSRSRKLEHYLLKMIEYTLDGLSIRKISAKIDVPINTVWVWRTKILNLLKHLIDKKNPLSNVLYSDETFVKINLKGTKTKNMPRKSYTTQLPVLAHRELVCIQSVIDSTKRPVFKIDGVAKTNFNKLNNFFKPIIVPGSILVSDGEFAYDSFTLENDLIHERVLPTNAFSRNGYSLGPINNLHSSFKFFLKKYRGVSLKRLDTYIDLFVFDFVFKKLLKEYELISFLYESILDLNKKITFKQIFDVKFPIDLTKLFNDFKLEGLI